MQKTKFISLAIGLLFLILLTACQMPISSSPTQTAHQNTLTVWSFFPNSAMKAVIRNYEALHPETHIIHTGYAFNALPAAFRERATQGLGPDAVILTERELPALIEAGLVENLNPYSLDTSSFSPQSTIPLYGSNQQLYGIPIAFQSMALCYNRSQVQTPARNLDGWLEQSKNGAGIALESGFLRSMWGIGAFGGNLFNSNQQFVLKADSLSRWLNWLKQAKQVSSVYLDSRPEVLYDLFASGIVAYYPCWTFEFVPLKEKLGDKLAIAPLPSGTEQPSPYLETDAFLLNTYATPQQKQLAIEFAKFMTQPDQQLALVSGQDQVVMPITTKVVLDQQLLPTIATFAAMVENAVPFAISKVYRLDRLRFYGDQLYTQVLQGSDSPNNAVSQFLDRVNNPPADEQIMVSASAASDEVQKAVLVDVQPNVNDLLELFRVQLATLKRPVILSQLFLVAIVLIVALFFARYLNKWLKQFLA